MVTNADAGLALSAWEKPGIHGQCSQHTPTSHTVPILGFGGCRLASDSGVLDLGKYVHTERRAMLAVSNVADGSKKDGQVGPKNGDQSAPFRTARCTTGQTI